MLAAIPFSTFPILHVGPLPIRTFGLFVALGILLGVGILTRFARSRDLDAEALSSLAFWVVGLGIVGARLLFVVTHASDFAGEPLRAFALWEGGLQFSGSFLLGIVVIWFWLRKHPDIGGLTLTDGLVLALTPGLIVGRLGCIAVGEHLGNETSFFLGWKYLGGETREGPLVVGSVVHNTAIYEFLLLIPLAVLLFWLARRRVRPGLMAATFFLWYGVQRFSTDFLRAYDRTVLGLTGAQYLALGMIAGGLWILFRTRPREGSEATPGVETGITTTLLGLLCLAGLIA